MDFDLSDDQVALRDVARELLDGLASPTHVRSVVEAGGGYDTGLWQAMVEQGWPGVAVAEDRGGLGMGTVEIAVLAEAVGGHAAPAPFVPTVLAVGALNAAGAHDDVERLVGGD